MLAERQPATGRAPLRLLSIGLLVVTAALATYTRADADLWGHVRFGVDSLETRTLTSVDPYSFTQDKPWVNHEWLSELMMGAAYRVAGPSGLVLLKTALLVLAFALMWNATAGISWRVRLTMFVLAVIGTIHITSSLRPQVWTLVCLTLLCRALADPDARARRWLPLVFLVWVNAHGGWIVGLGVLAVWAGVDVLVTRQRFVYWYLLGLLCAMATMINPYGWHLWRFMLETVGMTRDIAEWGPLWGTPFLNWLPWFVGVGAILWLARQPVEHRWSTCAVLMMLAYASARVMRIESLFITASVVLLAPAIRARWPASQRSVPRAVAMAAGIALVIAPIGVMAATRFHSVSCIEISRGLSLPDVRAMRVLERAQSGRAVTFFDWGQYAIWHLGPRVKVSIDGRRETVYSDLRLAEAAAIVAGTDEGLDVLNGWQAEYVWLPLGNRKTLTWLASHGYRIELETERSFVAIRDDLPRLVIPPLRESPVASCFPG
jgi:hypothetical protein